WVDQASSENLVNEIVGELAGLLDVEAILEEAASAGVRRTEESIEEAMRRARETARLQRDLFQHAVSYDAEELRSGFRVGGEHLHAFVVGMVGLLGGRLQESRRYPGRAWRVEMPPHKDVARLPGEGRITFSRELGREAPELEVMDLDHPFVVSLLKMARSKDFQGLTAGTTLRGFRHLVAAMLRWQDERGQRLRQEFLVAAVDEGGELVANTPGLVASFLSPWETERCAVDRESTQ